MLHNRKGRKNCRSIFQIFTRSLSKGIAIDIPMGAEDLLNNIVARHYISQQLHLDQGRNFESEIWKNLLGTKKTRKTLSV